MPLFYRRAGGASIEDRNTPAYVYGVTPQDRYDAQMARMFKPATWSDIMAAARLVEG